jgi:uncharacterized protein (TIGR02452 family)
MKKTARIHLVDETLAILNQGGYWNPSGKWVEIAEAQKVSKVETAIYEEMWHSAFHADEKTKTSFEVRDETTLGGLIRYWIDSRPSHLACLNFASARRPGGGFLRGADAQEESLCRSSGLYPCLKEATDFYEANASCGTFLYTDQMLFSPRVPFFRDSDGRLLDEVVLASVITAPAVNAGMILQKESRNSRAIRSTMHRRAERILKLAQIKSIDCLILGAWGCGVFQNDPEEVANIFHDLLVKDAYRDVFPKVVFSVYDRTSSKAVIRPFQRLFS